MQGSKLRADESIWQYVCLVQTLNKEYDYDQSDKFVNWFFRQIELSRTTIFRLW